jgi:leucyl aminopeptidase
MTTLSTSSLARLGADVLILPVGEADLWDAPHVRVLDRALHGALRREGQRQGFRGREWHEFFFQTHGSLPCHNLLVVGSGAVDNPSACYRLIDIATRTGQRLKARRIAIALPGTPNPLHLQALAEGFDLARYRFTRFRSHADHLPAATLVLRVNAATPAVRRAIAIGGISADATCFARDLINTPAGALTPTDLARAAQHLTRRGLRVRVHRRATLQRLRMGAILGVAQGSAQPPCLIECIYRPAGRVRKRVALVGKGITFDSGGLSLKTAASMQSQKRDMAGSAVVLSVMRALPELRLPIEVYAYMPATENMPGGRAIKPGDVVRAFNGKTIEVLNTDAEGRLVLADALSYAARRKPDFMLDFATLTAAVTTALGTRCAAIMGTSPDVIRACIDAASQVDERLWELPLIPDYRRELDSTIADLRNTGDGYAGSIMGGLFLREFVADVPWAHVDFSSTVMTEGHPCHPKGATGFGVRTVLQLLSQL